MSTWHNSDMATCQRFLVVIGVAVALLIGGCSRPAEEVPHYGGLLTYNRNLPAHGLDPWYISSLADREIAEQIYEGLLQPDTATFEPVPCLAEDWSIEDDGKTYVFHLRSGVRFQDDACFPNGVGREVTIEDVRFSFERSLRGPRFSWGARELVFLEGAEAFRRGETQHVSGIELIPPRTVVFHLKFPVYHFKYVFYSPAGYILPREAVEHYGQLFSRNPVGTGPFRLALWKRHELLLTRNRNYWQTDSKGNPLPYLSGVRIASICPSLMEWLGDLSGLHIYFEIAGVDLLDAFKLREIPSTVQLDSVWMVESALVAVNFGKRGPLQESRDLRREFLSRLNVLKEFDAGVGHAPLHSLLPRYFWGNSRDGVANHWVNQGSVASAPIGTWVDVTILGPNFPVETLVGRDIDNAFTNRSLGRFRYELITDPDRSDIWFVSLQWLYPDPEQLFRLFCSDVSPMGYKNAAYDSLFIEFVQEFQPERRRELTRQLMELLMDDAVCRPVFQEVNYYGWKKYVRNVRQSINPFSYHFWKYVWLQQN